MNFMLYRDRKEERPVLRKIVNADLLLRFKSSYSYRTYSTLFLANLNHIDDTVCVLYVLSNTYHYPVAWKPGQQFLRRDWPSYLSRESTSGAKLICW